ncbi:hypothetical protein ACIP6P_11060 [Streptomyces sp. NPDC088729]|uniref:hypothetical protein n=1 Tax=Streptomyces sp. NPDC088729 TaxID=3365876 RepID=UPI0037F99F5D
MPRKKNVKRIAVCSPVVMGVAAGMIFTSGGAASANTTTSEIRKNAEIEVVNNSGDDVSIAFGNSKDTSKGRTGNEGRTACPACRPPRSS